MGTLKPFLWAILAISNLAFIRTLGVAQLFPSCANFQADGSKIVAPNLITTGTSSGQSVSGASGFDSRKVYPNNGTNFDWWYFDAVSQDGLTSIVIVFYLATDAAFPLLLPGAANSVDIFVSFSDGTILFYPLNNLPGRLGSATIVTNVDGSSGCWSSTGFQWTGTSDMSQYVVSIDSSLLGVSGSLTLNSVAPAHYPCSPVQAGSNLEVSPGIGWANAVPDSNAVANFTVNGRQLQFTGAGYHDKSWSDQPFQANVNSWYWGHGRLGPYSIVWFDVIATDGEEYVSSYASLNGRIVASSCSGIKVRPTGLNSEYPPLITSGLPEGYYIELDLANGDVLEVNVTSNQVTITVDVYSRWVGNLTGGVRGYGVVYQGIALYEQFALSTGMV